MLKSPSLLATIALIASAAKALSRTASCATLGVAELMELCACNMAQPLQEQLCNMGLRVSSHDIETHESMDFCGNAGFASFPQSAAHVAKVVA